MQAPHGFLSSFAPFAPWASRKASAVILISSFLLAPALVADDAPNAVPPAVVSAYEARTFTAPDVGTLGDRLLNTEKFDAAKKYPLVCVLHGAGERGEDNEAQLKYGAALFLKPEAREKFACFVVFPQCPP